MKINEQAINILRAQIVSLETTLREAKEKLKRLESGSAH